jgi:hypothetical protein
MRENRGFAGRTDFTHPTPQLKAEARAVMLASGACESTELSEGAQWAEDRTRGELEPLSGRACPSASALRLLVALAYIAMTT